MYKKSGLFIVLNVIILTVFSVKTSCQDSLGFEQLQPLTYTFDVINSTLTGEGGTFLMNELSQAQFTMIGEYHGSKRISEFTEAVISILDIIGCKNMILEVGPVTAKILEETTENTVGKLRIINDRYMIKEKDGYVNLPVPFFNNIEDAMFLDKALKNKWKIMGIDQEFIYSYKMLIDRMYNNLDEKEKFNFQDMYRQVSDSITQYYNYDAEGIKDMAISMKSSQVVKDFTTKASTSQQNKELAEALYASNHIYWLNSDKQWFENNATRIKYMKSQLRKQLEENKFHVSNDRLLVKMGGYHLSKGFSPLALYEIGNTLHEIAEYYGNKTLNITFSNRFYMEEGKVKDILDSDNTYHNSFKDLNRMGKKDEWVVIDLRPMVKGHFYYPVRYKYNEQIKDLVKRYDLLIIPKLEMDPTPNYKTD
jgi:hypothetical protein